MRVIVRMLVHVGARAYACIFMLVRMQVRVRVVMGMHVYLCARRHACTYVCSDACGMIATRHAPKKTATARGLVLHTHTHT